MGDMMEVSDDEMYNKFIKAVELNDISTVVAMLQSMQQQDIILDINAVNNDNKTPLIIAITSKQAGKSTSGYTIQDAQYIDLIPSIVMSE